MPSEQNVRHILRSLSAYTFCGKKNTAKPSYAGVPVCQDCLDRKKADAQKFGNKRQRIRA